MKKFFLILFAGLVITACGGQAAQQEEQAAENKSIAELVQAPMEYEGQTVTFEGIIGHMCQHSGDKMRVHHKDDQGYSILVMLGDLQDQFEYEYEGREIGITGVMAAVLANEDEGDHNDHDHDDHDHENDHDDDHDCVSTEAAIQRLKERGVDPDIRAVVELKDFQLQ